MKAMEKQAVTHHTYVIERSYPTTPERVFAAFSDPAKKRRWYAAGGSSSDVEEFEMDFRVGGNERTLRRFKAGSPFPGIALINHTNYQDIVPNQRVVVAYTMTLGEKRISASLATFEISRTEAGSVNKAGGVFWKTWPPIWRAHETSGAIEKAVAHVWPKSKHRPGFPCPRRSHPSSDGGKA